MYFQKFIKYLLVAIVFLGETPVLSQTSPKINYEISIPNPESHSYQIELNIRNWSRDTLILKMPNWTPGYYQVMNYAESVKNVIVKDEKGKPISFSRPVPNTLRIPISENSSIILSYEVTTSIQFVANSYIDQFHAYLVPANTFFYIKGFLKLPVEVEIKNNPWKDIVTGLAPTIESSNHFRAANFDFLYDCPILMGNLDRLPPFEINGVKHEFVGYKLGDFDKKGFMNKLKKICLAAVEIIGDIPFSKYTFIGIGPGRGGIEHLNNTTVSFNGATLKNPGGLNGMLNFLAHEYFHHYNVKRIRPFELGPFDYENGDRTNLLWISEGLTVYYDCLIVRRAELVDELGLLDNFEAKINTYENNPGRFHQSLVESSYNTWKDGPFGAKGQDPEKSITYYNKGPIVGMFLDFAIRHATQNKKSLDDVMRLLYYTYYKKKNRGFTDAEFREASERVAKTSLSEIFEYVHTTKTLDYDKFLGYAGLKLDTLSSSKKKGSLTKKLQIRKIDNPNRLQKAILKSWQGQN